MYRKEHSQAINSNEWWNEYFKEGTWEKYEGEKQTLFFVSLFVRNCPFNLKEELTNSNYDFCDIGCAFGEGTEYLYRTFGSNVTGIDFSESAIKEASIRFPYLQFIKCDLENLPQNYDVIFCSNVLEHLVAPHDKLKKLCSYANKYVILLVPYEDDSDEISHINRFDSKLFEWHIPGFEITAQKIINTAQIEATSWNGKQALIVYKRKHVEPQRERKVMEKNKLVPRPETWDQVAETYQIEIEPYEYQLSDEIEKILKSMGVTTDASLIELGCGSGHLSACLAMKGYKTALLDFSTVALNKAKKTFDRYDLQGEFIQEDLMSDIVASKKYDIAWNSGVMEHFGDLELQRAIKNMAAYSRHGILFIVPNSKSVSYCLMRSRLMGDLKWPYGVEYLREDYDKILHELGYSNIRTSYLETTEISENHMLVANQGVGNLGEFYKLLMENGFLPESENYLVAYSSTNLEQSNPSKTINVYKGDTESKTKVFDLLSENLGLKKQNEQLNEMKQHHEKARCDLDEKTRELKKCYEELEGKIKLNDELVEKEKKLEQHIAEVLKQLQKEEERHADQELYTEDLKHQLEKQEAQLTEINTILSQKEEIINQALNQCNRMVSSRLFKMVHFINRMKYQGFNKDAEEKRKFRRWMISKAKDSGGDADHRYNPLFSVISILKGQRVGGIEHGMKGSLLGEHLERENVRLGADEPDKNQVEKIRSILTTRVYKGILVYPHVVYWEPLQTPQQLLRSFANNGWLCFFCEHSNIKDAFREVENNLIIVYEREFLEAIGNNEVVVLLTWLGSLSFVNKISNRRVWYHILDKLDLFPYYDSTYENVHQQWVKNAECVSYVAAPLRKCLQNRSNAIYLPNGVNPEEFLNVHESYIPKDMEAIVATGRRIIGYYGYLAEWMDYDMVRQAALLRPEYEFVFIGKAIYDTSKFEGVSNIHLLGLKPYKELSDYAKLFDVAIIPFVINEKMDCVSPIKFYEYCALGLPVVTSKMKEMEALASEHVACVDGIDEFLHYLDKFAKDDVKKLAKQCGPDIALCNTWEARARLIENELNKGIDLILSQEYDKFDVIILGVIDFDFRFQRPQHFATRFAENGHRVFYINANHFNPQSIIRVQDNLFVVNLHNSEFSAIHLTDWETQKRELEKQIRNLLDQYAIRDAITIVDYPNWVHAAKYLREQYGFKIITDYMDDYTGFLNPSEELVRTNCKKLLESSDQIIASSQFLADIAHKYRDDIVIIRNGTEYDHFHKACINVTHQRKVVGYYGAVAEWFDYEKVIYLAKNLPDCDIVIVGHVTKWKKELTSCPNIKLLGEMPYNELPNHLANFDVCLIPFDTSTDLIKATNPVKFYEYLSAGKKVVATDIPELKPYKDQYVYMSNDKKEFLDYVKLCLDGDDILESAESCMEFAKHNDWQDRFEMFESACVRCVPKVSIIVLTYNNLEINKLCIESIRRKTAYPNYELIIVDNCSVDGTRDYLKSLIGQDEKIKVILNEENKGFAGGNNVGLALTEGDYIVLLNNDTVITRGWITAMAKHLENDAKLGMCGPVTNSIGNEAKIAVEYHNKKEMERFAFSYTTEHLGEEYRDVRVLALFCTMIRKSVVYECGYLDETYGVGMFEDDDYAEAVKRAGYDLTIAEDAFIHHFEGVSFKKLEDETFRKLYQENKQKFEEKWNTTWVMHRKRPGISWETNIDSTIM